MQFACIPMRLGAAGMREGWTVVLGRDGNLSSGDGNRGPSLVSCVHALSL